MCLTYKTFRSLLKLQQNKLECFPLSSLKFVNKADTHSCGVPNNISNPRVSLLWAFLETKLAIKKLPGANALAYFAATSVKKDAIKIPQ
jgi:hypothetical protein